jgi:hypothetical protein
MTLWQKFDTPWQHRKYRHRPKNYCVRSAHTGHLCVVTAITSLLFSINGLVFITDTRSINCAVRTEFLYITGINFSFSPTDFKIRLKCSTCSSAAYSKRASVPSLHLNSTCAPTKPFPRNATDCTPRSSFLFSRHLSTSHAVPSRPVPML